jgi:hypothetical protein
VEPKCIKGCDNTFTTIDMSDLWNDTSLCSIGIGASGAAVVDPLLQTASITIKGSNDPHGVIQFSQNSLRVRTEEANHVVKLQLDRKFGAIGISKFFLSQIIDKKILLFMLLRRREEEIL